MRTEENVGVLRVPTEFMHSVYSKLTANEQLVFLHLASYCYGDKDTCYPSQATIAKLTNLSVSTVIRTLKSLIKKKVLKIINRHTNGKGKLNTYELLDYNDVLSFVEDIQMFHRESNKKSNVADRQCESVIKEDTIVSACNMNKDNIIKINNKDNIIAEAKEAADAAFVTIASNKSIKSITTIEKEEIDKNNANIQTEEIKKITNSIKEIKKISIENVKALRDRTVSLPVCNSVPIKDDELRMAIYRYFKVNYDETTIKYTKMLKNYPNVLKLSEAYKYIQYWDDLGYGDRSLCMFLINYNKFAANAERLYYEKISQYMYVNGEYLKQLYFHKLSLYFPSINEDVNEVLLASGTLSDLHESWIQGDFNLINPTLLRVGNIDYDLSKKMDLDDLRNMYSNTVFDTYLINLSSKKDFKN